ncbi:MAG: hypothetical protein H7A46_19070 [Verrucomicrobiales bacterium]|nr:hypothetical protein [Verrucomicrobiales bacterium]
MKPTHVRGCRSVVLLVLIWTAGQVAMEAGNCAVADGSKLRSEDGCMLAFMYNQSDDHRLVVIDEKNRRRYEARMDHGGPAPFWEGGKLYLVDHSGTVQGFTVGEGRLVPGKPETLCPAVVRHVAYSCSQSRLYVIRTVVTQRREFFYELSAIDFPARKTLWTRRIDDPGVITLMGYGCVTGLGSVEVFDCDTGATIGTIPVAKPVPSTDAAVPGTGRQHE